MSLWLLAASSKGFKKGLFLDKKEVSKSNVVSKGGENFNKDREENLDSRKGTLCSSSLAEGQLRTVCSLGKNVDSFRGAVAALGVTVCAPDVTVFHLIRLCVLKERVLILSREQRLY